MYKVTVHIWDPKGPFGIPKVHSYFVLCTIGIPKGPLGSQMRTVTLYFAQLVSQRALWVPKCAQLLCTLYNWDPKRPFVFPNVHSYFVLCTTCILKGPLGSQMCTVTLYFAQLVSQRALCDPKSAQLLCTLHNWYPKGPFGIPTVHSYIVLCTIGIPKGPLESQMCTVTLYILIVILKVA